MKRSHKERYIPTKINSKPPTPHFTDFAEELLEDPPICQSDLPLNKYINMHDHKNMKIDKSREEDFL